MTVPLWLIVTLELWGSMAVMLWISIPVWYSLSSYKPMPTEYISGDKKGLHLATLSMRCKCSPSNKSQLDDELTSSTHSIMIHLSLPLLYGDMLADEPSN